LLSTRIVVGRAVRNLRQQSQQRAGDSDRVGVAQRLAGATVTVDFRGTLRAQRDVMRRAQVGVHPQLTVNKGGNGLDRQMLGRAELPWSTDRRVVL
jgi:acetyl esterase/lipase